MRSAIVLATMISMACGAEPVTDPGICLDAETREDGVRGEDIRMWLPCTNDDSSKCEVSLLGGVRVYQRAEVVACAECYGDELVAQHPEICPQGGAQ